METKKIRIELLSDMCVSDGGIYNSAIDTDICYDSYGLPYIPGKRLKGCLRECAQELKDWGYNIPIGSMFGEKGSQKGKIIICNAYLTNRDSYINSIQHMSNSPLCHPQNILKNFSYIRTQTSIDYETGVADEKTLRTIRVANKGLVFEADVEICENNISLNEALEKCLAVFCHIGIARTRGYGEIHASLVRKKVKMDDEKKCTSYKQGSTELEYEIYLQEPIICKSVNGQEENSLDYIEGAKILGLVGQMLKDDGKDDKFLEWLNKKDLYFSNAYLAVDGKRLYEVPASVFEIKNNDKDYRNKIYLDKKLTDKDNTEQIPECDKSLQLSQMKHKYVYINEAGNMECHSVEIEMRYHHSRPKDKSIGKAAELIDEDSKFYQISSIREGQAFRGIIKGSADIIKEIYKYIENHPVVSLGYGRNGEYGRCNIYVTDVSGQIKQQEKEIQKFYVLLKSPAIIYNDKAMYSTDVEDFKEEIFANIFVNNEYKQKDFNIDITKYVNITPIGGFNVTWGQRKPTVYAFDKGTVICVELPKKTKTRLGQLWIGERCMEGFGETEVVEIVNTEKYQGKILYTSSNKYDNQILTDISKEPFLQEIASKLFSEFLRYNASINVHSLFDLEKANDSLKPTISNMLLICKETSDISQIYEVCKDRFSKSSGNKDKKLDNAMKILNHVQPEKSESTNIVHRLLEEFQNIYQIRGFKGDKEEVIWNMKYIHELLVQLKYLIRKKENNSKNKGGLS